MRLLVLSDIHANRTALEAVLGVAKGRWDRAVCLGDLVGYGPDPNEVVDWVRSLEAVTVRGNHDKAGSGMDDAEDFNEVARAAVVWTRDQLRGENTEFLRQLRRGPAEIEGISILHGAMHDEDEYLFAPAQALENLLELTTPVNFFGHTHYQGGFSFRDGRLDVLALKPAVGKNFSALRLEKETRYLLNPGSVGQPRDGDARAAFATVDLEHQVVEFWRAPYNVEEVQERMRRAGLPEQLVVRLGYGR